MSDVTYIKNGVTYVVSNPTAPIASDAFWDEIRKDSEDNPVQDAQQRVIVDRHVIRTSPVDLSGYVTSSTLNTALADYERTADLNTDIESYLSTKNYVDSTGLTSTLSGYVTNTGLATTLNDYVTSTGLNTALADYTLSASLINHTLTPQVKNVMGATTALSDGAIDCSSASSFTLTASSDVTLSFSNANQDTVITLVLTNGGAYTITYPSSVKWAGGEVPELTAEGTDIINFYTYDGGTTWIGSTVLDVKVA